MRPRSRVAQTLLELLVTLGIVGVVLGVAAPRVQRIADRAAARSAAHEAARTIGRARRLAIGGRTRVSIRIDLAGATMSILAPGRPPARVSLGERYGVRMTGTRDSLAFDPRGLGHGAANLTLVIHRGAVAETVVVSRLGRTR